MVGLQDNFDLFPGAYLFFKVANKCRETVNYCKHLVQKTNIYAIHC